MQSNILEIFVLLYHRCYVKITQVQKLISHNPLTKSCSHLAMVILIGIKKRILKGISLDCQTNDRV